MLSQALKNPFSLIRYLRLIAVALGMVTALGYSLPLIADAQTACTEAQLWGQAFSPDGRYVLMLNMAPFVPNPYRYDLRETSTGKLVWSRDWDSDQSRIAFHPTLPQILLGTNKGAISLDLKTGQTLREYRFDPDPEQADKGFHTAFVADVAYSPDGQLVVIGKPNQIMIWNLGNGSLLGNYTQSVEFIYDIISISNNGRYTLLGNQDSSQDSSKPIKYSWTVWDILNNRPVATLDDTLFAKFIPDTNDIVALPASDRSFVRIIEGERLTLPGQSVSIPNGRVALYPTSLRWQISTNGRYIRLPLYEREDRKDYLVVLDVQQKSFVQIEQNNPDHLVMLPSGKIGFYDQIVKKANLGIAEWKIGDIQDAHVFSIPANADAPEFWGDDNHIMYVMDYRAYVMNIKTNRTLYDFCLY